MGDDTLYTYTGDATSVMETLDEISGGLSTLMQDIQAVVDAASELTLLEDVLAGLANELDLLDGAATGVTAALGDVAVASDEAASSVASLGASGDEFATLTAAMEELSQMTAEGAANAVEFAGDLEEASSTVSNTTAQIDGLNSVIEELSTTIAEDTTIISDLNEQIANLEGQLGVLTSEEEGATEGAGGLAAAMGTVGDAATGLGDQLQAVMGPLMMIATIAGLVGGQLIGMGLSGQKGEVLLRGMAGASQDDINALQTDALKLGETMDQASAGFYEVESAGYAGSQAITVFDAASRLALGGAANQQDVMSGLTAIMHDYNASADEATKYTDYMAEAVLRGKQSMQDFSSNIGQLTSVGENVGLSFDQIAAAEATMTQINPHVAQDAQNLKALFQTLSPTMGTVVKSAQSLGLAFDEQKYSSLDLLGKLQYLSDISGGTSTAAFIKLTGGVRGSTAAIDLLKNNAQAFKDNLDAMGHSAGATANAFSQYEDSIPGHLDKASAALSIFGTRLMDALGPKIGPMIDKITDGIGHMADFILAHTDLIGPVLAGLAAIIGTVLVGAVVSFVAASWPIILILTGIGIAVASVVYAFTHWGQIMGEVHAVMKNPVIEGLLHVLQTIGAFLVSNFTPVWHQLVATFQTQLVPAWNQLIKAIQPLLPALELVGAGLAIVFGAGLTGIIGGVISMFAGLLSGIIQIFGGIVQAISGAIQIVIGIFKFFTDLTHGNFSALGADLGAIWQGIVTMFTGVWNIIAGIVQAFVATIGGFISGFVTGVVGFFENLANILVGHSIIPDMINGIINWFEQLPDRAGQAIISMVNTVISHLNNLASDALHAGESIIQNVATGITNAIGAVGDAIGKVSQFISDHLPHSPAKEGPLRDLALQGSLITEQISEGMLTNLPKLQSAISQLTSPISMGLAPGSLPQASLTRPVGGNDQATQYLAQMVSLLAQIVQLQQRQAGPTQMLTFNAASSGTISPQQLYQIMQSLSGYSYEGVQRGAL